MLAGTWLRLGPGTELWWTLGRTMSSAATASRQKSEEFQKWQLKARFGSMVIQDFSFEGHNLKKQDLEPNNTRWERKVEMVKILLIVYWKGLKAIIRSRNHKSKIQEWQWQTCVCNVPPNNIIVELSNIYKTAALYICEGCGSSRHFSSCMSRYSRSSLNCHL